MPVCNRSLRWAWVLLLCLLSLPGVSLAQTSAFGYSIVQLERGKQNHLLIRLLINGRPAVFMVDTGAPVSVISTRVAKSLHLPPPPAASGLPSTIRAMNKSRDVVWIDRLQAGTMNFGAGPLVADYASNSDISSRSHGGAVDGILGTDLLCRYKAILNSGTAQIFFKTGDNKAATVDAGLRKKGYQAMAMKENAGHFYIPCTLAGQPNQILVDTGAFVTFLRKSRLKPLGIVSTETGYRIDSAAGSMSMGLVNKKTIA